MITRDHLLQQKQRLEEERNKAFAALHQLAGALNIIETLLRQLPVEQVTDNQEAA